MREKKHMKRKGAGRSVNKTSIKRDNEVRRKVQKLSTRKDGVIELRVQRELESK